MRAEETSTQLQGITDLTLFAPIKAGFVGSFETITHVERLRALFKTLTTLRRLSRESSLINLFSDSVGRVQTVHSFRFVVVEPDAATRGGAPGPHKLLLNVTFDRGWEPYIRVIWRDLGPLLDVIFCHCNRYPEVPSGYPLAHMSSFDTYTRWVRANEVPADFLYVDSALTVSDARYLKRLEALQGAARDPRTAEREAAELAVEDGAGAAGAAARDPLALARQGLAPLVALHDLAQYFPANAPAERGGGDAGCLLRAAHDVLLDLRSLRTEDLFPPGSPERARFGRQLAWFEQPRQPRRIEPERLQPTPDELNALVQGGIVNGYKNISLGCMVLLRVDDATAARQFLGSYPPTAGDAPLDGDALRTNIAFTFGGLTALGVPEPALAQFPTEFREGMEARPGVLGDFRSNHPNQWRRPLPNWPKADPAAPAIDLSMVHVVVQLRKGGFLPAGSHEFNDQHPLYADVKKLAESARGLQVLAVQPMLSRRVGDMTQEHFGFLDGFSQPEFAKLGATPQRRYFKNNQVSRGELFLGYRNDRGDGPWPPAAHALFDNGTFLVVRKLRQDVGALHACLDAGLAALRQSHPHVHLTRDDLLARMMGRYPDGTPLADALGEDPNDFDFSQDGKGRQCPFQSHIRRSNPRNGSSARPVPRILRRGMSYGPRHDEPGQQNAERGVVFMAYSASIAEQFEVIQRWIAGGNSSGVLSGHSDPLLGVAQAGEPRTFRFVHGNEVLRIDLDSAAERPFVRLEWGLYLFVPSLAALQAIASAQPAKPAAPEQPMLPTDPPPNAAEIEWKLQLENRTLRTVAWQRVRDAGGARDTAYGVLVGSKELVTKVFRDNGTRYSVSGYGERMAESVGRGFLGMDDPEHAQQADEVNRIIESIDAAKAFAAARPLTERVLGALLDGAEAVTRSRETTFDIREVSDQVLAGLCSLWFGLPDGKTMLAGGWNQDLNSRASCPGHFMSASRFIFSPNPSDEVQTYGKTQGSALKRAVAEALKGNAFGANTLSAQIDAAVRKAGGDDERVAATITGVMLGFPPTVDGNLRTTFGFWLKTRQLWVLQNQLSTAAGNSYERANAELCEPMLAAMQSRPVPDMVWRTAKQYDKLGPVAVKEGQRVVVGILSAAADDPKDHYVLFGGKRGVTPHACSGYGMAIGVMLGIFSALMEAGTLKSAPGVTAVTLRGRG